MTPKRAVDEEAMAQEYAACLRGKGLVNWAAWNRAIIERWSVTALIRIKRRAWAIVSEAPHAD